MKIDHYCGGFECKMRRVGQILTKLSIAENFKEWTFGQFAWIIGLLTLRITTDRTYLRKDVFIMDVFDVNWKTVAEFLQKYPSSKAF